MIKIVLKVFILFVLFFIYTIPSAKAETSPDKIKTLAFGNIKDNRAIEPLMAAFSKDEDSYVREAAAMALNKIDPNWEKSKATKRSVPDFIARLKDKQWVVRKLAAEALFWQNRRSPGNRAANGCF